MKLKITDYLLIVALALVLGIGTVRAFTGPSVGQSPGEGGGVLFATSSKIGIGTETPFYKLDVSGDFHVSGTSTLSGDWSLGGAAFTNLDMGDNNISGVNKLTATTIDPVYEIDGEKYATYVPAMAGGVKEEYSGRGELSRSSMRQVSSGKGGYKYIIDFDNVEYGSDLWLWYKAVDFSDENVEVAATAKGAPVIIWYEIEGSKISFYGEYLGGRGSLSSSEPPSSLEFSYRLTGKRHDWEEHPTRVETDDRPSFILEQ